MKRVIIGSPYAGDVDANLAYLKKALRHSISLGEAPFASHGFYTEFLDDDMPVERKQSMSAGFAWMQLADIVAVYTDFGVSQGMIEGIERAQLLGIPVEFRRLGVKRNVDAYPHRSACNTYQAVKKWVPAEFVNDDAIRLNEKGEGHVYISKNNRKRN